MSDQLFERQRNIVYGDMIDYRSYKLKNRNYAILKLRRLWAIKRINRINLSKLKWTEKQLRLQVGDFLFP